MINDLYKQKTSLELSWQQEHNLHGKYTLDMVRIDDKIREVITEIKLEEAKIATRENAILDKLGEKSINWEHLGISYDNKTNRITYEEVIHDTRPLQTKKVLGVAVGTGASI